MQGFSRPRRGVSTQDIVSTTLEAEWLREHAWAATLF